MSSPILHWRGTHYLRSNYNYFVICFTFHGFLDFHASDIEQIIAMMFLVVDPTFQQVDNLLVGKTFTSRWLVVINEINNDNDFIMQFYEENYVSIIYKL